MIEGGHQGARLARSFANDARRASFFGSIVSDDS